MIRRGVFTHAFGGGAFGQGGQGDEPGFGHVGGQADGDAGQFGRLVERVARLLKARLGAGDAGVAAAGATAFAVPGADVAVGVHLRTLAAHVFHQAAEVGGFFSAGLEFVILVARAAVVHELVGVKARAVQGVEVGGGERAGGQRHERIEHPAGVGGAARDVDDGQTARAAEIRAEQAAGLVVGVLQATGVGGVVAAGGDAAPGGATAHGDDVARPRGQRAHPIHHGLPAAREHVKAPGSMGAAQRRAFDAQRVQPRGAFAHGMQQRQHFVAAGQRERGMPQQFNARSAQVAVKVGGVRAQQRHAAPAAAAVLQPEDGVGWGLHGISRVRRPPGCTRTASAAGYGPDRPKF